jgi:hypothetical protein
LCMLDESTDGVDGELDDLRVWLAFRADRHDSHLLN